PLLVFARRRRERAPAERHDAPLRVGDGKHQAVAEAVVVAGAARARDQETDALADRRRDALLLEERREPLPPCRGVSDAEVFHGSIGGGGPPPAPLRGP